MRATDLTDGENRFIGEWSEVEVAVYQIGVSREGDRICEASAKR